jgi:DNA-binding NarL/FixJ family response regulator
MQPQASTTVVVADVVPLVRAGIAAALGPDGFVVVGEAGSGAELAKQAEETGAAVAILGAVADLSVIDAVRLLRGLPRTEPLRVALLLGRVAREHLAELLSLEVDGLLPRTLEAAALPGLLTRLVRGERVVDPVVLAEDLPDEDVEASTLTAREREVLGLLSAGQSNREIASALYVSLPTVKTHLAHIYAKLGAKNRNEALGRAMALGLLG